ncbi:flagellar hook-basal body complex protein FliE [Granulicella aggregans]|jgi:flagellar hook-basal body complex protein FliE|uniref:Flagellar hook-basal body complex protein FliE n=1 Tax=Granulicella aggregans TaxID=474949 RepID=A0A7W8E3I6_9BACT|nr:flagellar hook-basal body complex protein FliE [Granulicella aggregans]MBB5057617.1 flagellar hook-basal body complex protein FliE [Granulicella aggregans]
MNIAERVAGAAGAISGAGIGTGVTGAGLKDSVVNVSGPTPFAGVMQAIVNQSRDLGKEAQTAVTGLLSGQGVEVHDVMIASQKASVAFELALQVRNKAVSAYQQMMGMQF